MRARHFFESIQTITVLLYKKTVRLSQGRLLCGLIPLKLCDRILKAHSFGLEHGKKLFQILLVRVLRRTHFDFFRLALLLEKTLFTLQCLIQLCLALLQRTLALSKDGFRLENQLFALGIQLMIGLPGDSMESCIYSAQEAA